MTQPSTCPKGLVDTLLRTPSSATLRTRLLEILELARWAPSGDNRQLWRVHERAAGAELRVVDDDLGFLDRGPAMRMALGAFGESFRLAAEHLRIPAELCFEPLNESGGRAQVLLGQHRAASFGLAGLGALLPRRCSNRKLYQPGSCSIDDLRKLGSEARELSEVELSFIDGERLNPLSRALALAETVRFRHDVCHRDFHSKVRWSAAEAEADPTGFSVDTFELRKHEELFLRMTRSWRVFSTVDGLFRVAKMAAASIQTQVQRSGAVVVFSIKDQSAASWIAVGRALQRVWLRATALGLNAQVLGVAPIFLHRLRTGGAGFSPEQQKQIESVGEGLDAIKGLPPSKQLALMLRVGRGPSPSARSRRLPADQLLEATPSSAGKETWLS